MSRSYKKHPCLSASGTNTIRFLKHEANITIRRFKGDIPNGKFYQKLYHAFWYYFDWGHYKDVWYTEQAYLRWVDETWDTFEKGEHWFLRCHSNEKEVQAWSGRPKRK